MTIKERIKKKTEDLQGVGQLIGQLQKALQEKQMEALKIDGALTQLKELEEEKK